LESDDFSELPGMKISGAQGCPQVGWLKPLFHRLGSTHPASSRRRNSPTWREDDDERNSNRQLDVTTKKAYNRPEITTRNWYMFHQYFSESRILQEGRPLITWRIIPGLGYVVSVTSIYKP